MKIKVDPTKQQPEPGITLTEAFDQIADTLEKLGRDVSHDREHAVWTQLRSCIYHMGYRPREREGKKLSITELAAQAKQAIAILEAVAYVLRGVPAAGVRVISGNQAAAWTLVQLPAPLLAQLETAARQQHCRDVAALLSMPRRLWQPPLPLDRIRPEDIDAATKLRAALLPWLHRQHDKRLTAAEMDAAGAEDYRRVIGHEITPRYWRELFARVIQRDNGFENWNRLEIYLPEKPRAKAAPVPATANAPAADDFAELDQFIAACGSPHDPTETERAGVYTLAFEKLAALMAAGEPEKSAARRVREFLFARCPALAPSRNALRMCFDRRREKYQAAVGDAKALRDGRADNGQEFQLPEDDRDLLIGSAVRGIYGRRGDIAAAWRNLLQKDKFSAGVLGRYTATPARKSYVPASVLESIAPEVEILTVMQRGPRAFDAIKGHVTRSYDGIYSLQCISGDDFTLNTYFYVPDGNDGYALTRGQVILFIDFRSLRILGWALEPHKSYSSLTIRSLCTNIFGEFGVPQVLYFERGIWRTATLIKGKTDPFTFAEISQGLREFGITFKHAIRPRTKAVERIGGLFQNIAEAEPGYCGRDERRDAPESLRKQMAEVNAKKVHPSKYFYSLDQWNHRLGQLVEQYNAEPQEGHVLAGLSPEQAFEAHINPADPPMQFSAELRYQLAHDKRLVQVTLNGVTIQIGKKKFNYKGAEISHLTGREALAWFDPENTESIVITNLDRTNPVCVARSENPNALESIIAPESGTLAGELARIEGQASHLKTRYNVVKAKFPLPYRKMLAAAQHIELGHEVDAQKSAHRETATRRQRQRSQAQRFAAQTGIAVPESAQQHLQPDDARLLSDFLKGNQ